MEKAKISKGLPKRTSRPGWKARYSRYIANDTRAKNKAKRIVKNALRSNNPTEIAMKQADLSSVRPLSQGVPYHTRKLLNQRGL